MILASAVVIKKLPYDFNFKNNENHNKTSGALNETIIFLSYYLSVNWWNIVSGKRQNVTLAYDDVVKEIGKISKVKYVIETWDKMWYNVMMATLWKWKKEFIGNLRSVSFSNCSNI